MQPEGSTHTYDATLQAPSTQGHAPQPAAKLPVAATTSAVRSAAVLPRTVVTAEGALALQHPGKVRYEVVRRLGEGAFGEVDLARDNDIDRMVALKRLKPEWLDPDTLSRFTTEIQTIGRLEHPGIVPVHDVGVDERGYFFVMKYAQGETLERIIERLRANDPVYVGRYPHETRAQIMLQLCRAVQFAHQEGQVHRDIKPANVMVGPTGEVMLMDWGLARAIGARESSAGAAGGGAALATMIGHAIGTPAYMSPEQARGEHDRTDARSDVYSLCAVFYELMALEHYLGNRPSVDALLNAVKHDEPLSALAMHHRLGVPPEYTWIIHQGLEKDPAKRFDSAAMLAKRIQMALEGRGPVQCPCTGLKRAGGGWSRFIDRHPNLAVGGAVMGTMAALYGVWAVVSDLVRTLIH